MLRTMQCWLAGKGHAASLLLAVRCSLILVVKNRQSLQMLRALIVEQNAAQSNNLWVQIPFQLLISTVSLTSFKLLSSSIKSPVNKGNWICKKTLTNWHNIMKFSFPCNIFFLHNKLSLTALLVKTINKYPRKKIGHTPYSKMAANKLFFCLHVY